MMKKTGLIMAAAIFPAVQALADTSEKDLKALQQQINLLEQKLDALASQPAQPSLTNTRLGAYGELHYNVSEGKAPSFDYHRFVLLLDHDFSETIRFYSELEVEHAMAGEGENGAVELEQAYIEWEWKPQWFAQFGMMLQPVGFINETHEPDTFYGVERPVLEKDILPTTWWSSGIGMAWRPTGWQLNAMVTEGLYDPNGTAIRSARQSSAVTKSYSFGYTLRANYTAIPGVTLGTSIYWQDDLTQGDASEKVQTLLTDLHASIQKGAFGLRLLWANWFIDGYQARLENKDQQGGWYIEPSYKLTQKMGVFARHTQWQTDADDPKTRWLTGINYWLHPRVVLKADYRFESQNEGYNLGVGYSF